MKKLIISVFAVFSSYSVAYEELSQEAFFANKENKAKYEMIKHSGKLDQIKTQMDSICLQWNKQKEYSQEVMQKSCECAKQELMTWNDEDLYYISMMAYLRYQAKVEALQNNDQQLFNDLKVQFKNSPLATDELSNKCEPKQQ